MVRVDGNKQSVALLIGMSCLVLLQNQACTPEKANQPEMQAAVFDVLEAVGPQVLIPSLERFATELELLDGELALVGAFKGAERLRKRTLARDQAVWDEAHGPRAAADHRPPASANRPRGCREAL